MTRGPLSGALFRWALLRGRVEPILLPPSCFESTHETLARSFFGLRAPIGIARITLHENYSHSPFKLHGVPGLTFPSFPSTENPLTWPFGPVPEPTEDAEVNHLNRVFGIAIAILIGTCLTQGFVYADDDDEHKTNARHNRIVGIWEVNVVLDNCSGVTVASFQGMHKYELGGTGQVVPATNPANLSEHSMIWSHVRGNDYRAAVKMFRFDPTGQFIGWIIIRNEISISKDRQNYSGSGVAEVFDANGNYLFASCPSYTGTRFN